MPHLPTTKLSRRVFLAGCTAATASHLIPARAEAQRKRPNILFVYTDDQGPWALGASGNAQAHTPNMDRLAAEGAYLTNSFVTTPVCSPSRVGLLCSRYGTEVDITDWINPKEEPDLGLDPSMPTWVRDLERAGYATALVGKWHLGIQDHQHPTHFGYQEFSGFRPGGNKVKDPELEVDGELKTVEGLTTDLLTDYALGYLDEFTDKQPFALSVHYRAPHAPWLPVAEVDWDTVEDLDPELPEPDFPDLDVDRAKKAMREYLASVAGVDRNLGRLLAALEQHGVAGKHHRRLYERSRLQHWPSRTVAQRQWQPVDERISRQEQPPSRRHAAQLVRHVAARSNAHSLARRITAREPLLPHVFKSGLVSDAARHGRRSARRERGIAWQELLAGVT